MANDAVTTTTKAVWWKKKSLWVGAVAFGGVVVASVFDIEVAPDVLTSIGDFVFSFVSSF